YAAAAIAERAAQEGISQLKLRTQHADLFIHLRSGRLSAAASMDIRDALGALIAATAASGLDPAELAERLAPMYDFRPLAARA
ncbi:MAG TPA: hypothetical protein VJB16_01995, partial [archaeon]|nr:hypothetical protein [archaeon]